MTSTDTTQWNCSVEMSSAGPVASLKVTTNTTTESAFRIKGVCYSPCPIGGSNNNAPNIGDWFWDTYTTQGTKITSWEQTWTKDLENIKALGVNTIRIYCMLGTQFPESYNKGLVFTHQKFLDACYALGLYVLVGFPLPTTIFDQDQTPEPDQDWWTINLTNTLTALGKHPAVMGFIIANEVDNGNVDTYGLPANKKYWWGQIEKMAALASAAAPDKLVGIANHDDPNICKNCAKEMASCPHIDFWGVNSYQPSSFASVFGNGSGLPGYASLTGDALKPVIITEYGFPSSTRETKNTLSPENIISTAQSQQAVASTLETMLPKAYAEQLNLGLFYFEYCDEWWNQSAFSIHVNKSCPTAIPPYAPSGGSKKENFTPPNTFTWYGGPVSCGFPNYYWDNEGFGLYGVAVGTGRTPSQPWNSSENAPALPLDTRSERTPVVSTVATFNNSSLISGMVTAITEMGNNTTQVSISSNAYGRPPSEPSTGSLTNYLYEPGGLTTKELQELKSAYGDKGKHVTISFASSNEGRILKNVIVGP